jgi:hypothetical protein
MASQILISGSVNVIGQTCVLLKHISHKKSTGVTSGDLEGHGLRLPQPIHPPEAVHILLDAHHEGSKPNLLQTYKRNSQCFNGY